MTVEAARARRVPVDVHLADPDADADVFVAGDADGVRRSVRHLLDNAARHADERVTVEVGWDGADSVTLVVDDDGSGVPEADRERIFERFVRLDEARTRDAGGAGLGLAVVREVVAGLGGDVVVGDAPAGGARRWRPLPGPAPRCWGLVVRFASCVTCGFVVRCVCGGFVVRFAFSSRRVRLVAALPSARSLLVAGSSLDAGS